MFESIPNQSNAEDASLPLKDERREEVSGEEPISEIQAKMLARMYDMDANGVRPTLSEGESFPAREEVQ